MILKHGLIVSYFTNTAIVYSEGIFYKAFLRKKHKYSEISICPGLEVKIAIIDPNSCSIEEIIPPKNQFIRPNVANIDEAWIILAFHNNKIQWQWLFQVLMFLEDKNISVRFFFNKYDILDLQNKDEVFEELQDFAIEYSNFSLTSFVTLSEEEINKLKVDIIDNPRKIMLIGKSGVGKSTFINRLLPSLNVTTSEIIQKFQQGRNTTTKITLYKIQESWIIDTPGFQQINLKQYELIHEIPSTYKKYRELGKLCKFKNCSHVHENDCNVIKHLKLKKISKLKYNYYKEIVEAID